MISSCVVVEKTKAGDFPVGSLVVDKDKRYLYRDINSNKHIFKKKDYQALATDDVVVRHLEKTGCDLVVFYLKDQKTRLSTNFQNFLKAKPRKMQGRLQRFVSLDLFESESQADPLPRPSKSMFIEV